MSVCGFLLLPFLDSPNSFFCPVPTPRNSATSEITKTRSFFSRDACQGRNKSVNHSNPNVRRRPSPALLCCHKLSQFSLSSDYGNLWTKQIHVNLYMIWTRKLTIVPGPKSGIYKWFEISSLNQSRFFIIFINIHEHFKLNVMNGKKSKQENHHRDNLSTAYATFEIE
jgi:hypothetical protein